MKTSDPSMVSTGERVKLLPARRVFFRHVSHRSTWRTGEMGTIVASDHGSPSDQWQSR